MAALCVFLDRVSSTVWRTRAPPEDRASAECRDFTGLAYTQTDVIDAARDRPIIRTLSGTTAIERVQPDGTARLSASRLVVRGAARLILADCGRSL